MEQDQREFAEFYAAAWGDCLRIVMVSVADRPLAEDLVAEAFTKAWASWPRVRGLAEPRAWVIRSAMNARVSWWRRRRREVALGSQDTIAAAGQDLALDRSLVAAVRRLPIRQREVIALRLLLDLDTSTTAEMLGMSTSDRKKWLLRTLGVPATDPARYAWELVAPSGPGRERQEDHHEQNEQVKSQEERISPREAIGQGGVGQPRTADRQEADDVGQVEGPGMKQPMQGCARRLNRDVQDEQRDGEAEHAVAESFHPVLAENPASARSVWVSWHGTISFASALAGGGNLWIEAVCQAVCPAAGQHESRSPDRQRSCHASAPGR